MSRALVMGAILGIQFESESRSLGNRRIVY
jgi:hypothetical protein